MKQYFSTTSFSYQKGFDLSKSVPYLQSDVINVPRDHYE